MAKLRDIKQHAIEKMPGSMFAKIIGREPDEISDADFSAKLGTRFAIIQAEES